MGADSIGVVFLGRLMKPRLAVLIDAENVPARYWPQISPKLDDMGQILTCRLFGDFGANQHVDWLKIARRDALQTVMQLSGRNASDIAITIAAMELLGTGKVEAFCLVASDRDYTPLVHRLRSSGAKVHGFGEAKAPASLRAAFTTFTQLTSKTKSDPAVTDAA
jgi:NYN domain